MEKEKLPAVVRTKQGEDVKVKQTIALGELITTLAPPPTSSLLDRVELKVSVCCGVASFSLFLSFLASTSDRKTHWVQNRAATTARGPAPQRIFTLLTLRVPEDNKSEILTAEPLLGERLMMPQRG